MAETVHQSPLEQFGTDRLDAGYAVTVQEVRDRGMIDLRGDPKDKKFMAAAKSVLGAALPTKPRTSATNDDLVILWLSLDQWLITMPIDAKDKMVEDLTKKTASLFALVCDMSDARAIIRLDGDVAREVLMKGTSVDLTHGDIEQGTVRRMTFAEIAAMCHIVETGPDIIDLYVFRSYADYAWEWIKATAGEASRVELFVEQPAPNV